MDDRSRLRRYLALVHHAEEALELSLQAPERPAPAEAVAALDDLVGDIRPAMEQMTAAVADPEEVRRLLAGWVH
ncbi:MAG: hypothetical protein LT102_09990 [Burkholderiaceae bacterium]|nr:hypothetical protein [Burkholderiaceae bacterium]